MWVSRYRCYFQRVLTLHSKLSRPESSLLQVHPPEHSIHLPPHSPALVNTVTSFPFNDSLPPPTQVVSFITAFLVFINLCIVSYRMLPTLYPIIRIFEIAISQKSFLSSVMLFFLTSCGSQSRSANESVLLVLCRQNQTVATWVRMDLASAISQNVPLLDFQSPTREGQHRRPRCDLATEEKRRESKLP